MRLVLVLVVASAISVAINLAAGLTAVPSFCVGLACGVIGATVTKGWWSP